MVLSTTNPAITHVAVTVSDIAASEAWYTTLFGVEPALDEDTGPFRHIVYPLGGTLFGLHDFPDLVSKDRFEERRPGLDHISFGCANRDELVAWAARLDELGIAHGDIQDAATARACRSAIPTTSPWSSSHRRPDRSARPHRDARRELTPSYVAGWQLVCHPARSRAGCGSVPIGRSGRAGAAVGGRAGAAAMTSCGDDD